MSEEKNSPIHRIRCGAISASIWMKQGDKGPWYTADVQRCYKGSDDKWCYTTSFGRDEILTAVKVLDLAHTVILRLEAAAKLKERKERPEAKAPAGTGTGEPEEDDVPF